MELEFHQMAMRYAGLRISMPGFEARLTASLATEGQLQPVLAVESKAEGYVLIDGYRRVSALRRLGRDTVETMVLPLDEPAALIFRHCQENAHQRSALEDGWLLRELLDLHGMSQEDMSRFLQRSRSWVSRRLSLVRELPGSVQDLVRQGKLCGHGAMKYLVPLARAKKTDCEELVGNLHGERISTRQMERLYVAWKRGDADQREKVVQRPLLYLKTAEELRSEPDEGAGDGIRKVFEDMEILDAVAGRAGRRVRELGTGVRVADTLIESWKAAQSSFLALTVTMEKRVNAGSGNEGGDSSAGS